MSSLLGKEFMNDNKQWHGGKGSQRRGDGEEAYQSNWDRIFGGIDYDALKDKEKDEEDKAGWGAYIILAKETMGYSVLEIFAIFIRIL